MQEAILLVRLIKAALRQERAVKQQEFDNTKLESLVRDQNLVSLLYPILLQQEEQVYQEVALHLQEDYNEELHRALVQDIEMGGLLDKLEACNMDCLPLKGYIMKNYYYDPTFRSMTDFDVLIREFDAKKIQTWMENIGYIAEEVGDEHHDTYFKKPYTVVEMHKNLSDEKVEREIPQIDEWLEKVWERCILMDGKKHTYAMTDEDFYIYHMIHLYKHIRLGGISIRPLIDTHVLLEQMEERLDWTYIDRVFEELQLKRYERIMVELSRKCFGEEMAKFTPEEEKLLGFFLGNGLFGDTRSKATTMVLTAGEKSYSKGRIIMYFRFIFRPAKILVDKYPILDKYPCLLPFVWVIRIFRVVFKERHKVTLFKEASSKEEYKKMQEIFSIAGISEK